MSQGVGLLNAVETTAIKLSNHLHPDAALDTRFNPLGVLELSATQEQLFTSYTFSGTEVAGSMKDSFVTQGQVMGRLALPGYFAAEHGYTDVQELQQYITGLKRGETTDTLRQADMKSSLRSLSFGPNGSFADTSNPWKSDVFESLTRYLAGIGIKRPPIPIYELCQKNEDGDISISPEAVKTLRLIMKHDNKSAIVTAAASRVHGSRGCPVSQRSADVREDDFSDHQWELMLSGDNPIASYDAGNGKLTQLRRPIDEFTDLTAEVLEKAIPIDKTFQTDQI